MPLQKQTVPVVLGQGIDTKSDPKQVVAGKMLVLENGTLDSTLRIKKRVGYEELADLGETTSGFVKFNDDLLAFGNETVNKYSVSSDDFVSKSIQYRPCQISQMIDVSNAANVLISDSATVNGVKMVAWQQTGGQVFYQLFDTATNGAILTAPIRITPAGNVNGGLKTVVFGNYLLLVYSSSDTSPDTLSFRAIDTNNSNAITDGTIATDLNEASPAFDVCILGTFAYVTWFTSATSISIKYLDSSLALSAVRDYPTLDATQGITIAPDTTLNQLWIGFCNATDVRYTVLTAAMAPVLLSTRVEALTTGENIVISCDNGSGLIFYDSFVTSSGSEACFGYTYKNFIRKTIADNAGAVSNATLKRGLSIMSKPFKQTTAGVTTTYILAGYFGHAQGFGFLLNSAGTVIARIGLNGVVAGRLLNTYNHTIVGSTATLNAPPEVTAISSTEFTIPVLQNAFFSLGYLYSSASYTFNFDSQLNSQYEEQTNNAHITGGMLMMYDGANFVEHNFLIVPEPPNTLTRSYNGVDNNFPAGTYQYLIVFEWFDNQGNFHQSAASDVTSITIAVPTTQIAVTLPTLKVTFKSLVTLSVYRTDTNGDIFYRVESTPSVFYQNNDAAVDFVTYNDTTTSATLLTRQQLYTTGGELDNEAAPSPAALFTYRNRLMVIPAETPNTLWFSKAAIQGIPGIPTEFSSFLQLQVNTAGGEVKAGCQIDDKCVLFKPNAIFYFSGDGPSATGANNDFTQATQVPTNVGTDNPRSVVVGPFGAIFQSSQGWYLCDRSLNVVYIGKEVEAYNSEVTISAQLIENQTQVRFMLQSGTVLVYDYLIQQWYVFTNYSAVDALIYDGEYTFMNSAGKLFQETPGIYSDNGQFITLKMQTSWLSFAGLQAFQRVYKMLVVGQYYTPHALQIEVQYDFNPNTRQTVIINTDDVLDYSDVYGVGTPYGADSPYGGDYNYYQFRVFTEVQKCETIQFTIQDIQIGEIGQGFAISNIAFEVGVKKGLNKLPAVRSFG